MHLYSKRLWCNAKDLQLKGSLCNVLTILAGKCLRTSMCVFICVRCRRIIQCLHICICLGLQISAPEFTRRDPVLFCFVLYPKIMENTGVGWTGGRNASTVRMSYNSWLWQFFKIHPSSSFLVSNCGSQSRSTLNSSAVFFNEFHWFYFIGSLT